MVNTKRTPTSRKSHHKEFIHKAVEITKRCHLAMRKIVSAKLQSIRVSTEAMCDDGLKQK